MVTQNMLRTSERKQYFSEINLKFAVALDLNICLKQFKTTTLLRSRSPISELPSNTTTMGAAEINLFLNHRKANTKSNVIFCRNRTDMIRNIKMYSIQLSKYTVYSYIFIICYTTKLSNKTVLCSKDFSKKVLT